MSDVLLSIRGLHVTYGRIEAVRGVDLEVHAGEVVGLLGPNGAGKSSVLAALMGTVNRTGEIRLDGVRLGGREPEAVAAMGVSIVPEGRRLFSRLSVAENLRLGATARTGEHPEVEADVEELKGRFPILGERWNEPAAKLSGGQQQQLAIARALVARPRLLLMDEPSLGLDPKTVRRVFEVITELKDAGQSILLAEQNALRTTEVADRIYVLRTGTVARTGAAAELREELDYRAEYLGADVDEKDGGGPPDRKAGREDR